MNGSSSSSSSLSKRKLWSYTSNDSSRLIDPIVCDGESIPCTVSAIDSSDSDSVSYTRDLLGRIGDKTMTSLPSMISINDESSSSMVRVGLWRLGL